ncbi:hypothetical protein P4O66_003320 [Electrophorus voltai]|uniref:Uncharacterized protein n=1 Tax=Electrophorus voltai TaxID=2609070 RepID=A0AAD9DJD5_9TELE|nr:hypothetical protein P4O66_003320 [Electrophorus voltai]
MLWDLDGRKLQEVVPYMLKRQGLSYPPLWRVQEPNKNISIPADYRDLAEVVSPVKATQLLREWDCVINLREGAIPAQCRVYLLSQEEELVMEQYIREALAQGYIHPSTSPASASVFVKKRDCRMRPCVDYRVSDLLVSVGNVAETMFMLLTEHRLLIVTAKMLQHLDNVIDIMICTSVVSSLSFLCTIAADRFSDCSFFH